MGKAEYYEFHIFFKGAITEKSMCQSSFLYCTLLCRGLLTSCLRKIETRVEIVSADM